MSRAFIKEDGPDLEPLADLPISDQPNFVTPQGLAQLQSRQASRKADLDQLRSREDRLDRMPEKAAERDLRYLDARLRSAIVIDPATHPPGIAAFGHLVDVIDEAGTQKRWQIVGEDQAEAGSGKITLQSPLARQLVGARIGDVVDWHRPGGVMTLTVIAIS